MISDIGIDLGTYKTTIFSDSKVILELPSVVTVNSETYEPLYFGEMAQKTLGRTPDSLISIYPIENGMISDYDIAEAMLRKYMSDAFGNKVLRPRIMATLPPGLTQLQYHSLSTVIEGAGGRNISVMESPLAVAYGLELDFDKPHGYLIVDIGAGTTDIAVISMGGIVNSDSFKTGSFAFDDQIIKFVRKDYNIEIGKLTAEKIKKEIGSLISREVEVAINAKGRNILTGLPEMFEITTDDVFECIKETAEQICAAIKAVISKTEPDLLADIKEDGLYLTGGGSLLSGFAEYISDYLELKVNKVDDPTHSVVRGAAMVLRSPDFNKNNDYQMRSIKELEIN
ncbi:MAG: rod shape-determining protein [Clostridia bacterium]|nr:rod shape-determining protein [Clostridia bacterium]MBR3145230.1 rod shape-determining protein [Clostridia bacterium]